MRLGIDLGGTKTELVVLDQQDDQNLFEWSHPNYSGERLVTCRNPRLAKLRTHKCEELLQATEKALERGNARTNAQESGADPLYCNFSSTIGPYARIPAAASHP